MKIIQKVFRHGVLAAFMLSLMGAVSVFSGNVFAVDENAPDYRIAITPTIQDLGTLKPGDTFEGSFRVKNTGKQEFDFKVSFSPYSVTGNQYDANFDSETQYTELKNWITTSIEEAHLASGGEQEVKYTVKVPTDIHGGAQAASIMLTMDGKDDGGIKTSRQLAYILYGNIDGKVTKTGKVLENKIPGFIFTSPITATSLVENTGNVYTRATYKLQVFPLFSDEEVYTNEEEPEASVIFPETERFHAASWEGAPQLGIFKVRQTVKIFDDESVVEKLVFICPIWFLFIVLLIIFVAIFWIISRIRGRNRA